MQFKTSYTIDEYKEIIYEFTYLNTDDRLIELDRILLGIQLVYKFEGDELLKLRKARAYLEDHQVEYADGIFKYLPEQKHEILWFLNGMRPYDKKDVGVLYTYAYNPKLFPYGVLIYYDPLSRYKLYDSLERPYDHKMVIFILEWKSKFKEYRKRNLFGRLKIGNSN